MSPEELADRLGGVTAVLVAPFSGGYRTVNDAVTTELAQRCDEAGIHALTVLGNTGEVYQLDVDERLLLLRATAAGRSRSALIAGLAGPWSELLRTTEVAAELGYDAVMLHDPPDPLACDEGLREFLLGFADESPLPVVLYLRTRRLSRASVLEAAAHPRIVGVKYAVPDLGEAASLLSSDGALDLCVWVCGLAEGMLPPFVSLGVRGFTSGLANVRPDLALGIWEAARAADWGEFHELVRRVLPFELLRQDAEGRYNVSAVKVALEMSGIDVGEVRPPCASLPADKAGELEAILSF